MIGRQPKSTLTDPPFPNTTLFRSHQPRNRYRRNRPWYASGEPETAGPRGAGPGSRACDFSRRSGHREEGPAARPTTDECHVRAAARTAWGISCAERRLRSEEHTSELQSLMRISYAVFCLKKKNRPQNTQTTPIVL